VAIIEKNLDTKTIIYQNGNKKIETKITGGTCKLQWKVDWAMRWVALGVDFEMYGKDLIPSAELSGKICKVLGGIPPTGFAYELFLDENGEKISKSKGNGITIEQWLKYASPESLSLYMYQNPTRAKKLYSQVIPRAVDEYLSFLEKFEKQEEKEKLGNPVWHIHNGNPPKEEIIISFNILLNLVSVSNTDKEEVIWKFIKNFNPNLVIEKHPILAKLILNAINYFNDVVKINKKFKKPDSAEKKALQDLAEQISKMSSNLTPEEMQTIVYSVGKTHYSKERLREWFKMIYEVLFGDEQGPRMGSFISFYGIKETVNLINKSIND
jgi:lysyl-tRNA synthetase class 1